MATTTDTPPQAHSPNYLSDMRPHFEPFTIDCGSIPAYSYKGNLQSELKAKTLTPDLARALLEDMLIIREMEEMIVKLRAGAYDPLATFNYRGPTHVSVGQEGTAVGACSALLIRDKITSTHRGHGESLAKGTVAIRAMDEDQLRGRVPGTTAASRKDLLQAALEQHVYRTIGELFGKDEGIVGPLTTPLLDQLHFDTAFMGSIGVSLDDGLTTTDPGEAFTKKLVVEKARRVVVLADSSKIGKTSFSHAGDWDQMDILVTDRKVASRFVKSLKKKSVRVITA